MIHPNMFQQKDLNLEVTCHRALSFAQVNMNLLKQIRTSYCYQVYHIAI